MTSSDDRNRRTSRAPRSSQARGARPSASRVGRPAQKKRSAWRPILRIGALVLLLAVITRGVTGCVMYNQVADSLPDPSKPMKGTDRTKAKEEPIKLEDDGMDTLRYALHSFTRGGGAAALLGAYDKMLARDAAAKAARAPRQHT